MPPWFAPLLCGTCFPATSSGSWLPGFARCPRCLILDTRLAEELRKDEPCIGTVSAIISKDVGMTAKILQLVNSAFFGLPQPAATLSEAVTYLGLSTIQSLVLSLKLFSQFDPWAVRSFSIESLEEHSWLVGVLAQRIAQRERCDPKVSDHCFLAGMLHDVGHLILAAGLPGPYHHVLHHAETSGQPVSDRERAEFGATHAELGAYLLGLWGLPESVVEAVAMHHGPSVGGPRGFSPLAAVHVADCMTPCPGSNRRRIAHTELTAHSWPRRDWKDASKSGWTCVSVRSIILQRFQQARNPEPVLHTKRAASSKNR